MADLIAQSPLGTQPPVTIGQVEFRELALGPAASVTPFRGQGAKASAALKAATGLTLPQPNRTTGKGDARAIWTGPGKALVIGADLPDLSSLAAVADQGDGIAALTVQGAGAEAVLARLVPLDLRAGSFKTGHTARTFVGHMSASVIRTGTDRFDILVMRSMGRTLWDHLTEAAEMVAARAAI